MEPHKILYMQGLKGWISWIFSTLCGAAAGPFDKFTSIIGPNGSGKSNIMVRSPGVVDGIPGCSKVGWYDFRCCHIEVCLKLRNIPPKMQCFMIIMKYWMLGYPIFRQIPWDFNMFFFFYVMKTRDLVPSTTIVAGCCWFAVWDPFGTYDKRYMGPILVTTWRVVGMVAFQNSGCMIFYPRQHLCILLSSLLYYSTQKCVFVPKKSDE